MELNEIFRRLEEKEGFHCGEGQNEEAIEELERKLNMSLSEQYKAFLKRYGYAYWEGGRIYGISKKIEEDVTHKNKLIRKLEQPENLKLPDDAVPIEDYGDAFIMLFAKDSPRSGAVVLYLSEHPWPEKSWESFKDFLEDYYL